jgi:hypothetical protein
MLYFDELHVLATGVINEKTAIQILRLLRDVRIHI